MDRDRAATTDGHADVTQPLMSRILGIGIARPPGAMPNPVILPRLISDQFEHPWWPVAQIWSEGAEAAKSEAHRKEAETDREPNYRRWVTVRRHEYLGDAPDTESDSCRDDPKTYQSSEDVVESPMPDLVTHRAKMKGVRITPYRSTAGELLKSARQRALPLHLRAVNCDGFLGHRA